MRKPVIGFTDSEFAKLSIRLTRPFTQYIFTPECFYDDFGKNHYRFKGYMESFYLQTAYFKPDPEVLSILKVKENEPFYVMRFVSFNAGHDIGESGMDERSKMEIAEYLSSKGKLFISSEAALPEKFEKHRLPTSPRQFHSVLAYASLYVGEGITTASECAQLGTPAVLINTLKTGYINEQVASKLSFQFNCAADAIPTIREIAEMQNAKEIFTARRDEMLSRHIDCTDFLVRLLNNFPGSVATPVS
jgi:predicted glycosyltransferase